MAKSFDVFLSHNSSDRDAVIELAEALKGRHLRPWLDVRDLPPELVKYSLTTRRGESVSVARDLNNLAQLLQATNRLSEAEPLMRRALEIVTKSLGDEHPNTQLAQRNLDALLEAMDATGSEDDSHS